MPRPLRAVFTPGSLLVLAVIGCSARSGRAPASKSADDALREAPGRSDDPSAAAAQLDDYEARLRAAGIAVGDTKDKEIEGEAQAEPAGNVAPEPTTAAVDPGDRCTNICDLAAAICDLRAHVCDLATRHPDEPRYAEVCARAEEDCSLASDACEGCDAS